MRSAFPDTGDIAAKAKSVFLTNLNPSLEQHVSSKTILVEAKLIGETKETEASSIFLNARGEDSLSSFPFSIPLFLINCDEDPQILQYKESNKLRTHKPNKRIEEPSERTVFLNLRGGD